MMSLRERYWRIKWAFIGWWWQHRPGGPPCSASYSPSHELDEDTDA